MIAAVEAPHRRELRAAGLAALAEAGVVYLPAHLIVTEAHARSVGALAFLPVFVAVFVGGVLLACRFRASPNLWVVGGAASVLVGIYLGRGGLNRTVFTVAVSMLVTARILTLALRDWRTPIHAELGWGAAALGGEALLAAGPQTDWRGSLLVIVPVFFVASLASRATTVWAPGPLDDLSDDTRAGWLRRSLLATGGFVVAMAAAVALGIRGGLFDRLGAWLAPAGNAFAEALAWSLAQLARPVFWLVERFHIDPRAVREFFDRLRAAANAHSHRQPIQGSPASLVQRILGLVVFAAIVFALLRLIRRFRPELRLQTAGSADGTVVHAASLPVRERPGPMPFRRELPADHVRRLYAELLIELERHGVRKDPALTPAEFEPELSRTWPTAAPAFRELTRAYEDVRYGNLAFGRAELKRLDTRHRAAIDTVRSAKGPPKDETPETD